MCHSAAWARTMPSARCASSSAAGDLGYGPEFGTRYFSNTHVTPMELSHSHTSVPSRSIASTRYAPPGKTTTAAPLFFPFGP